MMMRSLLISSGFLLIGLAVPASVWAQPKTDTETPQTASQFAKPELPSKADIEDMLESLPDMNAIMSDMFVILKDEDLREEVQKSAETFAAKMKESDAFETGPDGLPDFNKALAELMGSFADEEGLGGMLEIMTEVAEELSESTEKYLTKKNSESAP